MHLMFNVFAVVVIFGLPFLRELPLQGAEWLADIAAEKRSSPPSGCLACLSSCRCCDRREHVF
ncbi:hypothetical protein ULF88_14850 [Halopseudomonas pachastrellae]|nr:hypothetical protein [Halopseudomonas pachastrellae]